MRVPDLSLALRNIFRRPGFALVAITLLALGAGANAAVFSVVRGVLLRPLPFPNPDRLVAVWPGSFISNEEVDYWRAHARSFDQIAAISPGWMMGLVADSGEPIKVTGGRVSDNLFLALGAGAAMGRTVEPGDARAGAPAVVVLSHSLWQSRFNSDPSVVGRTIQLDGQPHTIVGVMPRGFEIFGRDHDLWSALVWNPADRNHKATFSQGIGRLSHGVTADAATRELAALAPAMRKDLAKANDWGRNIHVQTLRESMTGNIRPALLILLGAVGLILMLAAVNLGTLVLGRSIERTSEMALRSALGASQARLLRLIVVEQAVLAAAGSLAGIALAYVALPMLISRIPAEVPRTAEIALDWNVLVTVLSISIAVAISVALVPALITARPELQPLLRQSRVTETPARRRALGALVAVQIALAVVLGIGSMLMLRSMWNLQRVDPGFDPENVLTFRLQTTSRHRAIATGLPYLRQMIERVGALPGVTDVGLAGHLPMSGYAWTTNARRSDRPLLAGEEARQVGWRFVHGDYFQAMRIPIKHGRAFTEADTANAAAVALLNETMAREYFDDAAAAVGRTLVVRSGRTGQDENVEIVGVVGDVRHISIDREPVAELFRPFLQTFMFPMAMVVRAQGPPEGIGAAVRQAAFEIDPVVPVAEMQTYTRLIADTLGRPRLVGFLLTIFAAAGLGLGLVGVYGVAAYRVRQREREIGIRLALGADPRGVARGVVAQGVWHAAAGVAIGVPAAFLLSRVMASMLFGVTARDPLTFTALPALIVVVTTLACFLPARRAARIDPITTLRRES
jgi:putative ABC transport system permease protein